MKLVNKFKQLKQISEDGRSILLETIELSASLGNLQVNIEYLMDEIKEVMKELGIQSENALSFAEETTASMEEINRGIEDSVKNVDDIIINVNDIVKNNEIIQMM